MLFSPRRASKKGGGTWEAEGDRKSTGQGQPEKLINFSLTLCRGANNIEAFKHRIDVFFFSIILKSSFLK